MGDDTRREGGQESGGDVARAGLLIGRLAAVAISVLIAGELVGFVKAIWEGLDEQEEKQRKRYGR